MANYLRKQKLIDVSSNKLIKPIFNIIKYQEKNYPTKMLLKDRYSIFQKSIV